MRIVLLILLSACSGTEQGTPPGHLRSFGLRDLQTEERVALLPEKQEREFVGEIKINNHLNPEQSPVVVKVTWGVSDMKIVKMSADEVRKENLILASVFNRNRIVSLQYELTQSQPGMIYKDSGFSMNNLGNIQYLRGNICFDEKRVHLTGSDTSTGGCKHFYVLACGSIVDEDSLQNKSGRVEVTDLPCKLEFVP